MIDVGTMKLKVQIDSGPVEELDKDLEEVEQSAKEAAEALEEVGTSAEQAGSKASDRAKTSATDWKAVGDILSDVGSKAMELTSDFVDSAKEQEVSLNRAESVWGYYADTVLEASNNTEDYLSQAEYLNTVNDIGAKALAKGYGQASAFAIAERELAASQKLATATGQDQGSLMDGLNNAFMGITGNLGNYTGGLYDNAVGLEQWARDAGISEEAIEAGTYSMEEQAQMIEYLSEKLGGAGEVTESTAQKQAKLEANIADLKAQLGEQLLPIIQKILDFVTPIVTKISELPGPIQALIVAIPVIVAAIGGVVGVITTLTAVSTALNVSMLPLTITIVAIVAAIAALVAAGVYLYQNWDVIKAAAIDLWQKLKSTFENIKTTVSSAWTTLVDKIKNKWQEFKNKIDEVVNNVKTKLNEFKNNVSNTFSPVMTFIDNLKSRWESLRNALSTPIRSVVTTVNETVNKVSNLFHTGNFRNGTNYIPYDGYYAVLHRGERVLTSNENREYTKTLQENEKKVGNVTYNITVPDNPNALQTALTLRDLTMREQYGY